MNTGILEYIVAIAEERSVSKAAERFYLSHPALSRHLKNIEQELGCPLFERTGAGMQLTPAGLVFISDARAILHITQNLDRALSDMRHQQQHMIRVMVDAPFYNRFVQQVIPRFTQLQPRYTVDIVKCNASEASDALHRGAASLATFISTVTLVPDLVYVPYYTSRMRLVFPRDYRGKTDLAGFRQALESGMFLSQFPAGSTTHALIQERLSALQIYPKKVMEGETRTIVEHVIGGNACCILPEFYSGIIEKAGLVIGDVFSPLNHVLAYSPQAVLSPVIQQMMQVIIDVFSLF